MARSFVVFVLAIATSLLLAQGSAAGKGGYTVVAVTVSGSGLSTPHMVAISLPEDHDEMFEIPSLESRGGQLHERPQPEEAALLPYDVVLHYDFSESGYGQRTWSGRSDGDRLYFPEPMIVGDGMWDAGWYRASPPLAEAMRQAVAEAVAALPAAGQGDGGFARSPDHGDLLAVAGLALMATALLFGRRPNKAQGTDHLSAFVDARSHDVQMRPGSVRHELVEGRTDDKRRP